MLLGHAQGRLQRMGTMGAVLHITAPQPRAHLIQATKPCCRPIEGAYVTSSASDAGLRLPTRMNVGLIDQALDSFPADSHAINFFTSTRVEHVRIIFPGNAIFTRLRIGPSQRLEIH